MLAPIVLFVYNRPWHTKQTVESLLKNDLVADSELFVFADGPKSTANEAQIAKVHEVRDYIHTISGFKSVTIEESDSNKGLANSIIYGVSKIVNAYGKIIVLEDDLISHKFFLRFVNECLDFYERDKRIFDIGATNYNFQFPKTYTKDVYIAHRCESCGWGTWADRWNKVDWNVTDYESFVKDNKAIKRFNRGGDDMADMLQSQLDGKIDSWAIRWDYHLYKHDAFCLRPRKSLVKNIGFDGTGVHCGCDNIDCNTAEMYSGEIYDIKLVDNIKPNRKIEFNFKKSQCLNQNPKVSWMKRIKRLVKKVLRHII